MYNMPASKEERCWDDTKFFRVWQIHQPDPCATPDLHYGNTIEINIYENVSCDAYINGKYYSIRENCVVFIPPGIVHSFAYYTKSPGTATLINIEPSKISHIFNIEALLSYYNLSYLDIPTVISEYDEPYRLALELAKAEDMNDFIIGFTNIFKFLKSHITQTSSEYIIDESQNKELMEMVAWTQQRISQKIVLDEIAANFGYSKSYFCKKFKKLTGISYIDYLTQIRIQKAAKYLKAGYSIKNVADMCGFEDTSYFIHKFKTHYEMTPKTFAEIYKNDL